MDQSQTSRNFPGIARAIGFISPLACIGQPPEHREYRWKILRGEFNAVYPHISPSAIVEAFATVDSGINTPTHVGSGTILMKHSHVGHDAHIGDNCNIAPGVIIGGYCVIGTGAKIGLGACIRPRIRIGANAIIGAGSVVVKDVPSGQTWVGNPARQLHTPSGTEDQTDEEIWMEWFKESRKEKPHLEGI